MEENKPEKMQKEDWSKIKTVAAFFDFTSLLLFAPLDFFLWGWPGFFFNIFVGLIFSLWFIIWKDKFGGLNFLIRIAIAWFLGEGLTLIPVVGAIVTAIPKWTGMVLWIKHQYEKGSSLMGSLKMATATK